MRPGELRAVVLLRDELRCMAPVLDPDAGPCYDRWGRMIVIPDDELEMDYVRLDAHSGRHVDERDHLSVCPGHHRGAGPSRGYQWATSNRRLMRDHLESLYGKKLGKER